MKKIYQISKNIFLTLAFMLTLSANAHQNVHTFTYNGEVYNITSFPHGNDDYHNSSIIMTVPDPTWTCYLTSTATNTWEGNSGGCSSGCFIKRGPGTLVSTVNVSKLSHITAPQIEQGTFVCKNGTKSFIGFSSSGNLGFYVSAGATLRYENPGTGFWEYNISGPGTVEFTSGATYYDYKYIGNITTAKTNILKGTLVIGDNGNKGSITGTVTVSSGAWLGFYRSDEHYCDAVVNGAGGLTKWASAGNLTVRSVNGYSGPTDIYGGGGTFSLSASGTIANSSGVYLKNADSKFLIYGNKTIKGLNSNYPAAIAGGTTFALTIDGGGNFKGLLFTSNLIKKGSATLTLSGTNIIGRFDFYQGSVEFGANGLGTGDIYFQEAGTGTRYLTWLEGNTADISGRLKVGISRNVVFDIGSNNVTFNSETCFIHDWFIKDGTGRLTIKNNLRCQNLITVAAGTLQVYNYGTTHGNLGGVHIQVYSGATLDYFTNGATELTTVNKTITGKGNLKCSGTGTVKLTEANTYEGETTVTYGTLLLSGSGSINNTSEVKLSANTTLEFNVGTAATFSKNISGAGKVVKSGTARLTFTGTKTYTGETVIESGALQLGILGEGTTVGANGAIPNSSGVNLKNTNSKLNFRSYSYIGNYNFPSYTYKGVISGVGTVEIDRSVTLSGNNTYTGITTVNSGSLTIGSNGTSGEIKGNVVLGGANAYLKFNRSDNFPTYSGIISGNYSGVKVVKAGAGKLTLNGKNTFQGPIEVDAGTLALGANCELAPGMNTCQINLAANTKLDVSAANHTIGGLNSDQTTAEVLLGAKTLTIFGGGAYKGKISGAGGGIKKSASSPLTISGDNTATGLFELLQGTVTFTKWNGNFTQNGWSSAIDVVSQVTIYGTVTLKNGKIIMNLQGSTPSKLNVVGPVFASGTTVLQVTTKTITNYAIMQATSGLTPASLSFFELNLSGATGSLSASGTELLVSATVTDNVAPTPGAGVNATADINPSHLYWELATDDKSPQESLRYFVYQSNSNNISTVDNCEANGTLLNTGGTQNINGYYVFGLTPNTTYYFNVVVMDQTGNKAAYITKQHTPGVAPKVISVTLSPSSATMVLGETKQFTATVVVEGGANQSVTWEVIDNNSDETTISADGKLTIGDNETSGTIKVIAYSFYDPDVFDVATVTISNVGVPSTALSNQITVYPNPTTGQLTMDNGQLTIKSVELYDVMGRKLFEEKENLTVLQFGKLTASRSYDLTVFPSGVYYLKIVTENGVVMKKIIKN